MKDFSYFINLMTQDSETGSSKFKTEFTFEYAHVLNCLDEDGDNLAHCAVVLDHVVALKCINRINHEALKLINNDGYNITQRAAMHDKSATLKAILDLCPELIYSKFNNKNLVVLAYESKCALTFNFLSRNYKNLTSELPNYPALHKEMDTGSFSDDEDQIDRDIGNTILDNLRRNAAAASKKPFNPGFFWSNPTQPPSVILNIPYETSNHNGLIPFNDMPGVRNIANDLSRNISNHIIAARYSDFNIWLAKTFITYGRDCKYKLDMDLRFSLEESLSVALIEYSRAYPNVKGYEGIEMAFKNTFDSWVNSKQPVIPNNTECTLGNVVNSILLAIDTKVQASGIDNFKVWLAQALTIVHAHYKHSPKLDSDLSNNLAQALGAALDEYSKSNVQNTDFDGIRKAFSDTFYKWADTKQGNQKPTATSTNPQDIFSKSIHTALHGYARVGNINNFEGWLNNRLSSAATQCPLDSNFRGMLIPELATVLTTGNMQLIDETFNIVYDDWIVSKLEVNSGQGESWVDRINAKGNSSLDIEMK